MKLPDIFIYNTINQQKEVFRPIVPGQIKLYVCGMTVYDYCHIGHARVSVAFDAIVKYLTWVGYKVNYVRNITDIDDKIIDRAKLNNETMEALTTRFIDLMHEDFARLGISRPTLEPKATHHMPYIIDMIQILVDKKIAYLGDNGDVYFAVDKYNSYGELSHRKLDELKAGERVEIVKSKHSPHDFVLWKKAKPDEPNWDSPWGPGRPGWHIECSAMSTHCLGETIDIHGGGFDLIFPHHENERAQSEGATGQKFVNYWMHVGFVQVNDQKMAKSLKNFFTIREVLAVYHPEVVRLFLLSSHYRSPINYTEEGLENAKNSLARLYLALHSVWTSDFILYTDLSDADKALVQPYRNKFMQAMNDDFNTPLAISVLFELAKELNLTKQTIYAIGLIDLARSIGLLPSVPQEYLQANKSAEILLEDEQVKNMIVARTIARNNKNFSEADRIRKELESKGVIIEDTKDETSWRRV
jgi:cysteinyl-tRNA synthetase